MASTPHLAMLPQYATNGLQPPTRRPPALDLVVLVQVHHCVELATTTPGGTASPPQHYPRLKTTNERATRRTARLTCRSRRQSFVSSRPDIADDGVAGAAAALLLCFFGGGPLVWDWAEDPAKSGATLSVLIASRRHDLFHSVDRAHPQRASVIAAIKVSLARLTPH
eukprot:CAMPEP_0202119722 /NCGR_PEP_ID=MMETSP0965-20130614/43791_1 /ASSEMBLY_ACC=CAM_ASM_000507 /TAXON_ID=4773 /ORGANISM="Schizochytrium aggregatum, Strain ATCC28209" /LENGTH=166 /DNA_ID=CAMNT_0048689645 /DNA_START=1261 /DNA_END=1761 /DNA_ORIENTATION=+